MLKKEVVNEQGESKQMTGVLTSSVLHCFDV